MSKDWSQKWQSGHSKYHWHDTSRHGAVKGTLHLLSSVGHSAHGAQHAENFKHRFSPSKLLRHPWRLLQTPALFGRRRLLGQISLYSSRNKEQELLCFPRSFSFDFKPLLPWSSNRGPDTMLSWSLPHLGSVTLRADRATGAEINGGQMCRWIQDLEDYWGTTPSQTVLTLLV